jgi:hypothetical protein
MEVAMEREFVAQRLRNRLHEVEALQQQALAATSALLAELPAIRQQLGLSAVVGMDEEMALIRALAGASVLRAETVSAHKGFEKLAKAMQIRTRGDLAKPGQTQEARAVEHVEARSA